MSELVPDGGSKTPDYWTDEQNSMYSRLLLALMEQPTMFRCHEQPPVDADHWETTAHNVAWLAAEMMDPEISELLFADDQTDELVGCIPLSKRTLS